MSMTRKDYVALAESISRARGKVAVFRAPSADTVFSFITEEIALDLASDNPRFDRDRFMAACRVVQS